MGLTMKNKFVDLPSGVYSYNPEQALDLILTKPNAFLLLGLIAFKIANNQHSYGLNKNEMYFVESNLKVLGYKPILTRGQLRVALNNLIDFGFIRVTPHMRGIKIIKLLVNPFCLGGENGK